MPWSKRKAASIDARGQRRSAADVTDPDDRAWQEETTAAMSELAATLPGSAKLVVPRTKVKAFDLSVNSLSALDDFLGKFPVLHEDSEIRTLIEQSAAYLFEVARREYDGVYVTANDPDPVAFVVLVGDVKVTLHGLSRILSRIGDPANNIPFYFEGIASAISSGRSTVLI